MNASKHTDLLVIGGGIVGLSVAYESTRRGARVMVVERDRPGAGATDVAAGMLAAVSEAEATQPELLEFGLESCRLYPQFIAHVEADGGLQCGYDTTGTLSVALDRDHLEQLDHRASEQTRLGLQVEALSVKHLRQLEPRLGPRLAGGYLARDDHQVDPRAFARALVAAIKSRQGKILAPARLQALAGDAPSFRARIAIGDGDGDRDREIVELESERVLIACGAWSHQVLPSLADLPLRPVKGQVVRLQGETLAHHVIRTPDVYIVPRPGGELLLGATSEEQGFDERPIAGPVMDLLTHAWRTMPGVYELELREVNVGFRPTLRDHLPALGKTGTPGLYLATGHYRHGIMQAPASAVCMSDLMFEGQSTLPITGFDPRRFANAPATRTQSSA